MEDTKLKEKNYFFSFLPFLECKLSAVCRNPKASLLTKTESIPLAKERSFTLLPFPDDRVRAMKFPISSR
jgi:hypothetical protein